MTTMTMWRALNASLRTALEEIPETFLMGEEIARWGAGGGIFGVTKGLIERFGTERVRDTPISEEAILSSAVGAAMAGMRPIVEIMYSDFLLEGADPIINQAAKARYMFGGQFDVSMVIRTCGGAFDGKAAQHSQSLESLFAQVPGLEVVLPSTPHDGAALLRSAIESPNPTLFIEHKALYYLRGEITSDPVPLGRAAVTREGDDVTVVAAQLMMHRALEAAELLANDGVSVEVVDIRSLYPLDSATILESAAKTGRVLVCHEAPTEFGYGAEISSLVTETLWRNLKAPVYRLGGYRAPIPYSVGLEHANIPSVADIADRAATLMKC